MKLFYQLEKFGNKHKKYKKTQAKSFVKSFLYALYTHYMNLSCVASDVNNVPRTFQKSGFANPFLVTAIGGNGYMTTNYDNSPVLYYYNGIIVGTGNTAVASTDYFLQTYILNGVTSGKLEYCGNSFTAPVVSAPSASFTMNRIFRNSSGGDITIKEIGISSASECIGNTWYSFLIVRDVLGVPVTMANGDYLKVTYTFQITA